jgi:hypothetical protein
MEKPSSARIALKWGLISAVISIVINLVITLSNAKFSTLVSILMLIVSIGISATLLALAMREYRSQNNGYLGYGEGLGLGTLLSAISGLVAGAFNFIYQKFIDPTIVERRLNEARDQMESQGMEDGRIEQAMKVTTWMSEPGVQFVSAIFLSVLFGFLISLIVAAILRREKPVFE